MLLLRHSVARVGNSQYEKIMEIVRGYSRGHTEMERLTGRLTACAQQGLPGQLPDVTSDVDKTGLNNNGCSRFSCWSENDFTSV